MKNNNNYSKQKNNSRSNKSRGRKGGRSSSQYPRNTGRNGRDFKDTGRNDSSIERNDDYANASNSVDDFALDTQLLKDVASIPFSWAVGTPIDLGNKLLASTTSKGKFTIPGICRLVVQPSIGRATQASDPINVAANRIYSYVRHANSGSKNYDAPDLMLYLVAISNVYGFIIQCQRILGTIGMYSVYNRYVPDTLIRAMGANPTDVRSNLANFRARLNMLITKAASFAIPSNMPYFKNMVETLGNYYIEGTSMKDQIYLVYARDFYRFHLNTDGSGMLSLAEPASGTVENNFLYYTVDELMNFGESLLEVLIYSEDMNIMSGDILKAYGTEGIYKLGTVSEDFTVMPLMDVPVLEQIKNATTVHMLYGDKGACSVSMDITQDPTHAFLTCPMVLTTNTIAGSSATADNARALSLQTLDEARIMTTTTKDVSPELVMENSKFMVAADGYSHEPGSATATINLYPRNFLPLWFNIIHGDVDANGSVTFVPHAYSYATPIDLNDLNALKSNLHRINIMSHFKFSPIMHQLGYKAGNTAPAVSFAESEIYQDVDNYAVIEDSTLTAIHQAALLSLFHVVSIGQR